MLHGGLVGEAVALAHAVALFAQHQRHRACEHVAELLAHVRQIGLQLRARLQRHQNRLHVLLLRVGDEPVDGHAVVALLDEHVLLAADGVVPLLVGKELVKRAAQRREDVLQRGQGGRSLVALQLGDEALGELAAVGQLLLRQVVLLAKASDLLADVDIHGKASLSLVIHDFKVIIAMQIKTYFDPVVKGFRQSFCIDLKFVRFFMSSSGRIAQNSIYCLISRC